MQAGNSLVKHLKSGEKPPGTAEKAEPDGDELPRPFERLLLLKHLARGGMGEVYLAAAGAIEGAERPCVVKIIRREHADDRSFLARFFDEARIQAQLQHPGVAGVLEAATDRSGKPYVVVEFVEGRNLGEVRTRAAQLGVGIAWADAVALAVALGDALAHVHERTDASGHPLEIVHRDLSPQNVMVAYGGDVKLIDFGTARGQNRRCQTVAGIVFAKPGYVAPEVANNTPGGVPADIYAFGVMLWELVAGRRFLTGDASAHLAAVGAGQRNPSSIAPTVGAPPELDVIVQRMTALKVEERYASARHATSDLVALLKRAPSLANGDRSVRGRIAHLLERLYPAEPARTRAEFARLLAVARDKHPEPRVLPPSPTPAPTAHDVLAGTRYKIVREIGRGGMGVVYEAHHLDLGRTVALKVLTRDKAGFGRRFRTEARAIARLDHENLVKLHDFGVTEEGRAYYAMELLDGETLEWQLDRDRGMDWREAVRIGVEACRALEVAHAAGVVHRDIKPGNLFITRAGTVKLLDFGIARVCDDENEVHASPSALSLLGTPEYLAPEQASGGSADERSDVYALGAVLYELTTGRLPHTGDTTVALLDAKLRLAPEPPRQRAPQRALPKSLERVILRALDRSPERRFQTAAEMRAALERALLEPERVRRVRRRIGLAATLCVLAASGAGVLWGAGKPEVRERATAAISPLFDGLRTVRERLALQRAAAIAADAEQTQAEPPPAPASQKAAQPETVAQAPAADESESASASSAPPPAAPDATQAVLDQAEALVDRGQTLRAFHLLRDHGARNPDEPRLLRAWSEAALAVRSFGEAHRVARRWATLDESVEAQIHLARMERAVGDTDGALGVLSRLLERHPSSSEARELMRMYGGEARLARR